MRMQLLSRIIVPLLTVAGSMVNGHGTRYKHQHPLPYCDKGYDLYVEHEGVNKTVTMLPWKDTGYVLIPSDGDSPYGNTTLFNVDSRKQTRLSTMINGEQWFLSPYVFDSNMNAWVVMWTQAMWGAYRWRIKDDGSLSMYRMKVYNKAWQLCPVEIGGKLQDVIFRTDTDVYDFRSTKSCKGSTRLTAKCSDWREKEGKDTLVMEPTS